MAETLYLVDSNVLLRWVRPDHTDYRLIVAVVSAVLNRDGVLCYTSQNVAEFWNACTRPVERNGFGMSPQEADFKAKLFEGKCRLLPEIPSIHDEWRKLLVSYAVSGVQVHDARIVAAMKVYRVQYILTFNDQDFVRYGDIRTLNPRTTALP